MKLEKERNSQNLMGKFISCLHADSMYDSIVCSDESCSIQKVSLKV